MPVAAAQSTSQWSWKASGPIATINIPIRGTVSAPHPELGGVLSDLTKQILGGGVKDLLQGELNKSKGLLDKEAGKLLDGLFKPKPKP